MSLPHPACGFASRVSSFDFGLRRSEQLQAHTQSSLLIFYEAQALVENDDLVPGGVGLGDNTSVSAKPGDVHKSSDDRPSDTSSANVLACRDTNELAGPLTVPNECPSTNDFPSHAANDENMARSDVVVQNIIDIRVACFVDRAEVLAKPFEDEPASLLLVTGLKGSDEEFTLKEPLTRILLAGAGCH